MKRRAKKKPLNLLLETREEPKENQERWHLLIAFSVVLRQAVLIHNPAGSDPFGSLAGVEDKGFLQADRTGVLTSNQPVGSRCLPIARCGHTVRAVTISVLPVSGHVEKPLFLSNGGQG